MPPSEEIVVSLWWHPAQISFRVAEAGGRKKLQWQFFTSVIVNNACVIISWSSVGGRWEGSP